MEGIFFSPDIFILTLWQFHIKSKQYDSSLKGALTLTLLENYS